MLRIRRVLLLFTTLLVGLPLLLGCIPRTKVHTEVLQLQPQDVPSLRILVQVDAEPIIGGVVVLKDGAGMTVAETATGIDGEATIPNQLPSGFYTISIQFPLVYERSSKPFFVPAGVSMNIKVRPVWDDSAFIVVD